MRAIAAAAALLAMAACGGGVENKDGGQMTWRFDGGCLSNGCIGAPCVGPGAVDGCGDPCGIMRGCIWDDCQKYRCANDEDGACFQRAVQCCRDFGASKSVFSSIAICVP